MYKDEEEVPKIPFLRQQREYITEKREFDIIVLYIIGFKFFKKIYAWFSPIIIEVHVLLYPHIYSSSPLLDQGHPFEVKEKCQWERGWVD